jgi:hypothetical protein
MLIKRFVLAATIVGLAAWGFLGNAVEKYSASFSFPLTVTSGIPAKLTPATQSYFKMASHSIQKGMVTFVWFVNTPQPKGVVSIYSISGAVVKRIPISRTNGSMQCDLSKVGSGVYIATLTFGAFRQNLTLALYR